MAPTGHRVLLAVAAAAVAVAFTARAPVPVDAARVAAPSRAVIAVDVPGGVHPYGPRPPVVTIGRCRPCGPAVPGRCEAGTTCGKSNAGNLTCVKPMTVGKKCTDPCWTCAAGLTCGKSGTCELPTIPRCKPCGTGVVGKCEAGTTCGKSNAGNLTCVKPMTVGKKCTDPCWTCAAGLTCGKSGTCELPTIPRCKPCGTGVVGKCEAGTVCGKSNAGNLTCVKPMTVGKKCTDPCWTCAAGLTCGKSGTCELPTIPRCKPCGTGVVGKCEAGTTCGKSNAGNLTCVKPMTVGKKCTDPCWTCAAGLTCGKSGTCELPTIPRCKPCGTGVVGKCEAGTTCGKSNAGNLTCVKPMTVGKKCTDPCWTCAAGLTCGKSGTCELPTIPRCKPCGTGVVGKCEAGTTCGKINAGNLTCVKPMTVGKKCTDPCWTCAAGLTCGKSGTCELPTIPRCKPCGGSIRGRCEAGTMCRRTGVDGSTCVKPGRRGTKCTNGCTQCARWLTCAASSGTCELPTIPRCKPCGGSIRGRCEAGTMCRKTGVDGSTCVKPGRRGAKCTNGCTQCARWLTCAASSGTCERPIIRQCRPCGAGVRGRCEAGTQCRKNNRGALSCVKPMTVGKKCTDPCWTCAAGLTCGRSGTCQAAVIPACKPCGYGVAGRCAAGSPLDAHVHTGVLTWMRAPPLRMCG
ncbi:hypothetical protein I4F81_000985 [Pyropia yezoensis]|uniref:Uncharacterized protein n=1 Tax=Pyropia yezoensis TaxID=2788 RepID=A0ACC3BKV5_PYRYE|nr:hypothetical protein I4F81_000985 [Neopyropia yezoensis]